MLIPDANLLVYAYNEDAPLHEATKAWWEASLSGDEPVGLAWVAMLGFIRLMSNPRVLARPMAGPEAAGLCRSEGGFPTHSISFHRHGRRCLTSSTAMARHTGPTSSKILS